jgi:pectinesterase
MKKMSHPLRPLTAIALAALAVLAAGTRAQSTPATRSAPLRIALAGDSTVTDDAGWGAGFAAHLASDARCSNLSRGGRSSKSFIAEGRWKECLALKPDYVLIQFGHNDQPGHPGDRETDPQTTYRQYMTQYIEDARAAGIRPVLVTSLSRRQWGPDGKIHSTLQPYVDVVKAIAAEKHVPLIDLHARSIELYEKLGREGCQEISPLKNATTQPAAGKDDETVADQKAAAKVFDGTHLNKKGGELVGAIVAEELKKAVPELASYLH